MRARRRRQRNRLSVEYTLRTGDEESLSVFESYIECFVPSGECSRFDSRLRTVFATIRGNMQWSIVLEGGTEPSRDTIVNGLVVNDIET